MYQLTWKQATKRRRWTDLAELMPRHVLRSLILEGVLFKLCSGRNLIKTFSSSLASLPSGVTSALLQLAIALRVQMSAGPIPLRDTSLARRSFLLPRRLADFMFPIGDLGCLERHLG